MQKSKKKCDSGDSQEGETMTSTDYEAPFINKFPPLFGEEELPCIENDYSRAKAYLMKQCLSSGDNLWDHLNEVLKKILLERPKDIGCTFEEFSYRVRENRFKNKTDHLWDTFVPSKHYQLSQKILELFQSKNEYEEEQEAVVKSEEEGGAIEPNMIETFHYFEQGGVGLPKEEILCLASQLKQLPKKYSIEKYRFWGKILGTRKNYYIAETELNEEEMARLNTEREAEDERKKIEEEEKEAEEAQKLQLAKEAQEQEAIETETQLAAERSNANYQELIKQAKNKGLSTLPEKVNLPPWPPLPLLPQRTIKKTPLVPVEPIGTGSNKKVYFVCHGPGEEWIQLPIVTPQEIVAARKIKRAFTGDLESEILSYPTFPGKEKNFLRAQIARISAGTQISPLGYYTFNEEEEEDEDAERNIEGRTNYVVNPDFEPVLVRDLVDPSMAFWVHHTLYILEQGRTTWWEPTKEKEEEEDEDEVVVGGGGGTVENEEKMLKTTGPPLLTPLSEDSALDAIIPWSVRKTSSLFPEQSIAIVRSNLWPGAYAYATNKKFDNVYIGYGHKFTAQNHSPAPIPDIQDEYHSGPEVMEITDPTPEEEEEWRQAHEIKRESSEDENEDEEENDESEDKDD